MCVNGCVGMMKSKMVLVRVCSGRIMQIVMYSEDMSVE